MFACTAFALYTSTVLAVYSDLAIMSVGVRCVCRAPERFSRHYYEDSRHVFAIMNVHMEFAIMSVCSEFAIMSVGTTLSLQIRNNSILITATSCSAAISAAESGKSPIGNMETNSTIS